MKYCLLTASILIYFMASAQSPYLSISLKMDPMKVGSTRYKIEMKICEPKKMTNPGDWFTQDTSKINFTSLQPDEINCGEYLSNTTSEIVSGNEEDIAFNQFKFGNQVFAWEKILIFKISNWSSRNWVKDMYLFMPIKYKSFVTTIRLSDLEFQSGKMIFLNDYKVSQKGMYLTIDQSLKNYKVGEVKDYRLKILSGGK